MNNWSLFLQTVPKNYHTCIADPGGYIGFMLTDGPTSPEQFAIYSPMPEPDVSGN